MDRFKVVDTKQFGDVYRAGFGDAAKSLRTKSQIMTFSPRSLGSFCNCGPARRLLLGASASNGAFDGGGTTDHLGAQEQLGRAANHVEFTGLTKAA